MRFQLTRTHILAALDLTVNHTYAKWTLIMLAVLYVLGMARYHQVPGKMVLFLLMVTVVFLLFMLPLYLYRRRQFIRQFSVNRESGGPVDCEMVDGELVLKTERSSTSIPRDWIVKVVANRTVTLLFRSDFIFHVIPAEVIVADDRLRAYIEGGK